MWAKAEEGEISKDTVKEWERKTMHKDDLPEKVDNTKEGGLKQAVDVPYSQINAMSRQMGLPSIEEMAKKNPEIATKMLGLDKLTKTPSVGSLDTPLSGKEKAIVGGLGATGAAGGAGIGVYNYNKAQERMEKESSLKISHNLGRLDALAKLGFAAAPGSPGQSVQGLGQDAGSIAQPLIGGKQGETASKVLSGLGNMLGSEAGVIS